MNNLIFSFLEIGVFLGIFMFTFYLLIPKTLQFWRLWRESGKTIYLSNCVASGFIAFLVLSAIFIRFIKTAAGGW